MAAAVGDIELVRRHLDAAPDSIRMRISEEFFPMVGPRAGGTIYQWKLGWYLSPHRVALKFGHEDVYRLLLDRSPPERRLPPVSYTPVSRQPVRILLISSFLEDSVRNRGGCHGSV
jgi:hypothetical protein